MFTQDFFFEGVDWMELYRLNPDPLFAPRELRLGMSPLPHFSGRIGLAYWLGSPLPLPAIPLAFLGSPVTDIFPATLPEDGAAAPDLLRSAEETARDQGAWAVIVKDLPAGHFLEQALRQRGFASLRHEPIWYCRIPASLTVFLAGLSKGRRRGIEARLRKFRDQVQVRPAGEADLDFVKKSYDALWRRSSMRLEQLPRGFFRAALSHPACTILLFEREEEPFAFVLLWKKGDIWFDKYIGTDASVFREVSFYSMSILHLLAIAPGHGIRWYVAGQGSGKDKAGLGFQRLPVNLWIKPLAARFIAPYVVRRFCRMHNQRVYPEQGGAA